MELPACWNCNAQPFHVTTSDQHHVECARCCVAYHGGFRTTRMPTFLLAAMEWRLLEWRATAGVT